MANANKTSPSAENKVELIICYGAESYEWLSNVTQHPMLNGDEARVSSTRQHVALNLYHNGSSAWNRDQERQCAALEAAWGTLVNDAARADDCSTHMAYVVDRYDDLPEYAMFLQCDGACPYFPLAERYLCNKLGLPAP